jgi:hypothetical protein
MIHWINTFPPWALMWTLAFMIYAACKCATFVSLWTQKKGALSAPDWGYFLFWPGMDVQPFLQKSLQTNVSKKNNWLAIAMKLMIGILLLWGITPALPATMPLVKGWVGMIGLFFLLHLGIFSVLCLLWSKQGFPVKSLFNAPLKAKSLTEFWGERWNLAYHDLMRHYLYKPLRQWIPQAQALILVFLFSGLLHDLVISIPARAGYGLPTLYFLIQGAGLLFETKYLHQSPLLARRIFTLTIVAVPAPLLFHSSFINTVMLPFFEVIGAAS